MMGLLLLLDWIRPNGVNCTYSLILISLFFSAIPFAKTFSQIKSKIDDKVHKINSSNPVDISSVYNGRGGVYLFWKESRSSIESKVFYAYLNFNNNYPTDISGYNISELSFIQNNPKAISYISNDAVVAWKDYSNQFAGDLYLQRISRTEPLWSKTGVRINNSLEQIFDYSLCSDKAGNIFVVYITRNEYPSNDYNLNYQRVLYDGNLAYKNQSVIVESSPRIKNNLQIFHDNSGGAFILWTEKINDKESLLIKKCDPSGNLVFGKRPIKISGTLHNTVRFCADIINKSLLYIAWETDDKNIYHQLINSKGKAIWTVGGTKAVFTKGKNMLPQTVQSDSLITLCWLNDLNNKSSLYLQKFKTSGKEIWKDRGVLATNHNETIKNFSLASDGVSGHFVVWSYETPSNDNCQLGIQQIDSKGKLLRDSVSTFSTLSTGCEKNYFAVFPDGTDCALISYKTSDGLIKVERVPRFQKPVGDFLFLTSELSGKSVKLKISTNVKDKNLLFIVERLAHSDTSANVWEYLGTVDASANRTDYEFIDDPTEFGTLYYRTILKSDSKELLSNMSRIDYLEASSKIIVAQNNPNPFSDSTVISFYLPASALVALEYFDEHAEKIGEVTEREFPAGENSITFYARELQPGIYFYKLFTKDFVDVKKMVVD